jgi:hypothetical protein
MNNLIQYASAISAFGAKLTYDTNMGEFEIAEYPKREGAKKILNGALIDIQLFEDTSNFQDGLSIFALADFVDKKENPVTKESRTNILTQLGMLREGKFIRQILERSKVNRSWHISETSGACSLFGDICINRGLLDTSHRRGRKSERNPEEYHRESSKGIGREQLVTPAIELMYDNIPTENLISESKNKGNIVVQDITQIPNDELQVLIKKIEQEIKNRA